MKGKGKSAQLEHFPCVSSEINHWAFSLHQDRYHFYMPQHPSWDSDNTLLFCAEWALLWDWVTMACTIGPHAKQPAIWHVAACRLRYCPQYCKNAYWSWKNSCHISLNSCSCQKTGCNRGPEHINQRSCSHLLCGKWFLQIAAHMLNLKTKGI